MPIVKLEDKSIVDAVACPNAQIDGEEERLEQDKKDAAPDLKDVRRAYFESGFSEGVIQDS